MLQEVSKVKYNMSKYFFNPQTNMLEYKYYILEHEHSESTDLQQGSSRPPYCLGSQFGELAIQWRSFTTKYPQTVTTFRALTECKPPLRLDCDLDHH